VEAVAEDPDFSVVRLRGKGGKFAGPWREGGERPPSKQV
jgi:hypothetical protein